MSSKKLENFERKFELAESLVEELDNLVDELSFADELPITPEVVSTEIDKPELYSVLDLSTLKQDFAMIRTNIISLVQQGQKIMNQCSNLDIGDLKASQLDALSKLQIALGGNIKLLLDCYKDIAVIEKSKNSQIHNKNSPTQTAETINNTQIVCAGSSAELLKIINKKGEP